MKQLLITCAILAGFAGCIQAQNADRLSPSEFAAAVDSAGTVLIDVRTPEEYTDGYIAGALNIDYLDDSFPERIKELDPGKRYLVYCKAGGRSEDAVKEMQKLGFINVADLKGGIMAWPGEVIK